MTVQFANPADASKMPLGKMVALKGDFSVITQNKVSYLFVQNAKILYVDPFDRHAAAEQPAPSITNKFPGIAPDGPAAGVAVNEKIVLAGYVQPASNNSPPSSILCDPPQLSAVAENLDRRLCVQKDILMNLNVKGDALLKAARSFEPFPQANASNADPDAISCRNSSDGMTSRLGASRSALVCAFNTYWNERDDALRRGWVNNTLIPAYVGGLGSGQLPVR